MTEQLRMYQGPKQEKQYLKKQRQLLQQTATSLIDDQEIKLRVPATIAERPIPQTIEVPQKLDAERRNGPTVLQTSYPLVVIAFGLGALGLVLNGWYQYSRGTTPMDKAILCGLGALLESA